MGRIGVRQYILLAILSLTLSIVALYVVQKTILTQAAPGINKTINFQGKMTDDQGLNVADGNYQFVFRMYTLASGGTATWTETVSLDVTDGIFQHNLGSSTPLPGSVDFDTDNIFLGITFNADPDGEMIPRIQLTASPYAFNSDQLDGLDASDFVQLSPSVAQTGDIDITGSITAGSVSAGSLVLSDGSSNTATIEVDSLAGDFVYTIPTTTGDDTFCLEGLANCGGSTLFTDAGTQTYLTSTSDTLMLGTTSSLAAKLAIVGTGDQSQLLIRAYATQTSPLIMAQDSTGAELFRLHSDANSLYLGYQAGVSDDLTTNYNVGIGRYALNDVTTGQANVALGSGALRDSGVAVSSNTAIGYESLRNNTGSQNVGVGRETVGGGNTGNTGNNNVAVGHQTLDVITSGAGNTALGQASLGLLTSGSNNIAIGQAAGDNLTSGSNNIIIGTGLDLASATGSNQLNIAGLLTSSDYTTGEISISSSGAGAINIGTGSYTGTITIGNTGSGTTTIRSDDGIELYGNGGSSGLSIGSILASTVNTFRFQNGGQITTPNSGSSFSNSIALRTGNSGGSVGSGSITIQSGDGNGTTIDSGDVSIDTGTATGTAGTLSLGNDNASAINLGAGTSTGAIAIGNSNSDVISIQSADTINIRPEGGTMGFTLNQEIIAHSTVFRFAHASGGTGVTKQITTSPQGSVETNSLRIQTGSSNNADTGSLTLRTGTTDGTGDTSGEVVLQSGNGEGTGSHSGNITIDVGTATGTAGVISIGAANTSGLLLGNTGSTISFGDSALANCSLTTVAGILTCGTGSSGDILNGGNTGAVVIGSNDSTLAFEANGATYYTLSTAGLLQGGNGASLSVPGTGSQSEQFGAGAQAVTDNSLAVGYGAVAGGDAKSDATAIGSGSVAGSFYTIALGSGASSTASGSIAIGAASSTNYGSSVLLGYGATGTANNQFVLGSDGGSITNMYLGAGVTSANAASRDIVLNATGGSGTDIGGADISIAGGQGTGTGAGGAILLQTAAAGTSSSSLNPLTTRLEVQAGGNIAMDTDTLFVDATNDRVGIGDTTPLHALTIGADETPINTGSQLGIYNAGNTSLHLRDTTWNVETALISGVLGGFLNSTNTLTLNSGSTHNIVMRTASTDRLIVQSDGDVAVDTDTLFVDAVNNRVGIGTTTPGYNLDIKASSGNAAARINGASYAIQYFALNDVNKWHYELGPNGDFYVVESGVAARLSIQDSTGIVTANTKLVVVGDDPYLDGNLEVTRTLSSATGGSEYSQVATITATTADTGVKSALGFRAWATNTSGTIDSLHGLSGGIWAQGSGGTVNLGYGGWFRNDVSAGATINTSYGIRVDDGNGAGTIGTQYGLYVADMSKATTNYAIYTAGSTPSFFGGNLSVRGTLPSDLWSGASAMSYGDSGSGGEGQGLIGHMGNHELNLFWNFYRTETGYASLGAAGFTSANGIRLGNAGIQFVGTASMGSTMPSTLATISHAGGLEVTGDLANGITHATGNLGLNAAGVGYVNIGSASSTYGLLVRQGGNPTGAAYANIAHDGTYVTIADTATNANYAIRINGAATRFRSTVTLEAALPGGNSNAQVCRATSGALATCTSSQRYKSNISELVMGLNELRQLQPVNYVWTAEGRADVGFIAEQVANVLPQAVTYDGNGEVASFNSDTITALLTKATQELDVQVSINQTRLSVVEDNVSQVTTILGEYATTATVQTLGANLVNRIDLLEQGNFVSLTVAGSATVGGNLTVTGAITASRLNLAGKLVTSGEQPNGTVLGVSTAGKSVEVKGNDTAGEFSLVFDSGAVTAPGEQLSIDFVSAFGSKPRVNLTAISEEAAKVRYYVEPSVTGFTVFFIDQPEVDKTYSFNYFVVQ